MTKTAEIRKRDSWPAMHSEKQLGQKEKLLKKTNKPVTEASIKYSWVTMLVISNFTYHGG